MKKLGVVPLPASLLSWSSGGATVGAGIGAKIAAGVAATVLVAGAADVGVRALDHKPGNDPAGTTGAKALTPTATPAADRVAAPSLSSRATRALPTAAVKRDAARRHREAAILRGHRASSSATSAPHPTHPTHPVHPSHPSHPVHPAHPAPATTHTHPPKPDHPVKPTHPTNAANPPKPAKPPKPPKPPTANNGTKALGVNAPGRVR